MWGMVPDLVFGVGVGKAKVALLSLLGQQLAQPQRFISMARPP